eukprot:gene46625-62361_t
MSAPTAPGRLSWLPHWLRHYQRAWLGGDVSAGLIVAVLVFLFVHMLPGDPARLAAGQEADEQTVAMVRAELGLDKPLPQQFVNFFTHMLQGDFGTSIRTRRPVSVEIGERFFPTVMLTITSMVWAVIFGMGIGIVSAVYRNKWPDRLGMTLAVSGISFPAFALGMLLMQIFSVQLGWLPTVAPAAIDTGAACVTTTDNFLMTLL